MSAASKPGVRKRLNFALMAITVFAASSYPAEAQTRAQSPQPPVSAARVLINSAIEQAAARHQVDAGLVRAVMAVESNYNPRAVSPKGAMGLMQLMPETARRWELSSPFDPEQNIDAGVRHLKSLLNSYAGNVTLTLAAYNAGEGAVARSNGVPNFRETQDYIRRVKDRYRGGVSVTAPVADPVRIWRDARGILCISNND